MNETISVLIVDDSALVRKALTNLLDGDPDIQVLAAAPDPLFAERYLRKRWPDVIVLDLEMPRMDGMTFLRKIMRERPTPVVVCSSLTQNGTQTSLHALAAGAVGTFAKPTSGIRNFFASDGHDLVDLVKASAGANLEPLARSHSTPHQEDVSRPDRPPVEHGAAGPGVGRVVLIGASTGGIQAIETVLRALPATAPPIAIVQHMPPQFTSALAARLDHVCAVSVKEAEPGDWLQPGQALIAPGGKHLALAQSGARYTVDITDTEPVNRHKPSVDVLFRSAARLGGGPGFLALLLTGMGTDGAKGLLSLKLTRARTIVQDEKSCVVFGMPREAVRLKAAGRILPLSGMSRAILAFASARS